MKTKYLFIILSLVLILVSCGKYDENGYQKEKNKNYISNQNENAIIKNVILIIGDGMGENQVNVASMILEKKFDLSKYEFKSVMETSCLNNDVTDSAAAATALATGVKTNKGVVGLNDKNNELKTILDIFNEEGYKTGVVTDQHLTDATPAGFTSHSTNRYLNRNEMIIQQINGTIDLLYGLGYKDYFEQREAIEEKWNFANDKESFKKLKKSKAFAVFSENDNNIPSLDEMATSAINILSKDKKGFFLMIEAGSIDDYCNDGNIEKMADEVLVLDKTLRVCLNFMRSNDETIVIVLADHETGGLMIKEGKPDISWFTEPTFYHTSAKVPVYAFGTRSNVFDQKDLLNTDIFNIIKELMKF